MYNFRKLTLIVLFLPLWLNAQVDTTVVLPEIFIVDELIRMHSTGSTTEQFNQEVLNNSTADNIAELLTAEGGLYIKSYGLNSLATSAIRGSSAGQTLMLWNGLPMQSPMLGLVDLSLLPTGVAEKVRLQKGGNTALWGSGAIGGLIALENTADFKQKLSVENLSMLGQFGEWQQQVQVGLGNQKFQSKTKVFHHQAENDFEFFIAPGLPEGRQSNARFSQQNILQDLYWKPSGKHQISAHFWHQYSDREIPPLLTQTFSQAHQQDQASRIMLQHQSNLSRIVLRNKLAYFDELQDYFDDAIGLQSTNAFSSWIAESDLQWQMTVNQIISFGINYIRNEADSEFYNSPPGENRQAIFGSYQMNLKKLNFQSSIRQTLVDGEFAPLVTVLGFTYHPTNHFQLKARVSKNYRIPTLNDRFWVPGGNPDLNSESGWSQEIGLQSTLAQKQVSCTGSLNIFNRTIDNWILWAQQEGQNFWSASNLARVWSRGVESRLQFDWGQGDFKVRLKGGYDYIRSTNQVAMQLPKIEKGDQLIYTPIHNGFISGRVQWKTFSLTYQHQFTGASTGINDDLEAFHLANLRLQYAYEQGKYNTTFFIHINNLLDSNYLIIERRPMPGINWQAGFRFQFIKKQTP